MMSAPITRWVSITLSGVKKCLLPSMWERNSHPSSLSFLMPVSENTWKPPLSVRMGRSQPLKPCRPPAALSTSSPGRK